MKFKADSIFITCILAMISLTCLSHEFLPLHCPSIEKINDALSSKKPIYFALSKKTQHEFKVDLRLVVPFLVHRSGPHPVNKFMYGEDTPFINAIRCQYDSATAVLYYFNKKKNLFLDCYIEDSNKRGIKESNNPDDVDILCYEDI